MTFQDCLNSYIEELRCSGKELAANSGISETIISRYRKGERVPAADSEYLKKLSAGIAKTAQKKGKPEIKEEDVYQTLLEHLPKENTEIFYYEKFDLLLKELEINVSKMAAALHYDASYISKIRTGKRAPSDPAAFAENVCGYVVRNCIGEEELKKAAALTGGTAEQLENQEAYFQTLQNWLCLADFEKTDYISSFLQKMDEFNLDDYIRAIHFDSFKIPKVPFQLPVSRHYYGLKEMREGELDFLKHTVLSKSMEPLHLCSDMPVEDMAQDEEFARKYMFGLAMVLKKGLHIHIIHEVERPMKDMMLGLENWIPLYMTGQISPYYLKGIQNKVYSHLHYSSGQAAMTGDCISGHHENAHYYLTSHKEEVERCRKNTEYLLKKASPLMDIYREEKKEQLYEFLGKDSQIEGRRRRILAAPPLFIIPEELLKEILYNNQIGESMCTRILEAQKAEKNRMEHIFAHSAVTDELSEVTSIEYERYPVALPVAECFLERDIVLTFQEYKDCIAAAREYASRQEHYNFRLTRVKSFHNIQITCHEEKWCMVSKNKAPSIHFVIHHPKLRYALENVILPIQDET
ncbi:hypothetical protein [Blautia sp.]